MSKSVKITIGIIIFIIVAIPIAWLVQHQIFFAKTRCGKAMLELSFITSEEAQRSYKSCFRRELFKLHGLARWD
jgi:hypothetical protein